MFDVNAFLNSTAQPMATKFEVPPEGEFKMMIGDDAKMLAPKEIKWTDSDGKDRVFHQMELYASVLDDKVKQQLGRDKVLVRMRVNLDFVAGSLEAGKPVLDNGVNKNVFLGQIRDALGQNTADWTPAKLLNAGPFIGKISHTSDKKNPSIKYADVTKVAKIS